MIYTRGYEDPKEFSYSIPCLLLSLLALPASAFTVVIAGTLRDRFDQMSTLDFAFFLGFVFLVLFVTGTVLGVREHFRDQREWKEMVRVGGYLYSQHRLDLNLRRARFVVRVGGADSDDYLVNYHWLDHGGEFRTTDLTFPKFGIRA